MRRALLMLGAAALVLAAAGCSGGDGDEAAAVPSTAAGPRPELYGVADPQPGRLLLRFARAAGEGDARTMWSLLSSSTQARIGPSLTNFERSSMAEFEDGVGSIAAPEVLLSRRLGAFGVAAVGGDREVGEEREYFAYAVAFVREDGRWRIELGGVVVTGLRPEPFEEVDAQPEVAAEIGAGSKPDRALMWLDGRPFAAAEEDERPFAAHVSGTPEEPLARGRHEVVVFAQAGPTASALAWSFDSE